MSSPCNLDLVLIAPCNAVIRTGAFSISRYPVIQRDFCALLQPDADPGGADKLLQKATWLDAVRFCNRLCIHHHLPPSYCEETGKLLDAHGEPAPDISAVPGFRLPTAIEWEYAAKGWSGKRTGDYFAIHKAHWRVPYLDYPTTEREVELYTHGFSSLDDLFANHVGILGLLGYAREWCGESEEKEGIRGKVCHWEEYIVNYDNAIGYQVRCDVGELAARHAFRIAITGDHSEANPQPQAV